MDNLLEIIGVILLLTALAYVIINFKKIKYSYNIGIGIISIWCIAAFVIFIDEKAFLKFSLFNIILSVILQFEGYLIRRKIINILFIGIVWLFTAYSCLLCASMVGGLLLPFTQPISYLFGFYLLKGDYKKNILPIYINLGISCWISFLMLLWIISH